jgi:tetratricopeptide (TPR) repeat protein
MAQDSDVLNVKEMSVEELIDTLRDRRKPWTSNACAIGAPVHVELNERLPDRVPIMRGLLYAEALCADEQENYVLGAEKTTALEALVPDEDFSYLAIYFDRRLERVESALARIASMSNAQLADLDTDSTWHLLRIANKAGKSQAVEDFALGLADRDALGVLDTDLQGAFAIDAIAALGRADRSDEAEGLLAFVRSPGSFVDMLGDRKFEHAWPAIEAKAGAGLENVSEAFADWALARLDTNKSDRDRFSTAAHALHFAGRFQEAIDLAQNWRERDGAIDGIEEGDGWALNIQAYAYDALGRRPEADKVFDQLAELDADEHPWVVNFVINRSSRLVGHARWEDGLKAAELARTVAEKHGSTFAKMIVASNHVCALSNLDRQGETEEDLAFLRENVVDSSSLVTQALLCAGEREEAAALVLSALADEVQRDSMIGDLRPEKFELFYTPSILQSAYHLMQENEAIRAEFEIHARAIPDEFTPAAYLKRKAPAGTK